MTRNPVRTTTRFVSTHATDVRINHQAIESLAQEWSRKKITIPQWQSPIHLNSHDEKILLIYVIVLDSMNFCFWQKGKQWSIRYRGKTYSRSAAFETSLTRFFKTYPQKANFKFFSQISKKELADIFIGIGQIPLLEKRQKILRAVSHTMEKKYNGDPRLLLKKAGRKLSRLIPLIVKELPSFNDEARYRDKKIYLWKRAQILAADIYGALRGKNDAAFTDLNYLTLFADYRLPQLMQYLGILEYSPHLEKKIKKQQLIPAGSREEIEIRSATIQAGEFLRHAFTKHGKKLYPHELDWLLWKKAKSIRMDIPHHLTKTTNY